MEGRYGGDKDIPFGQQCNYLFCIAMPPGKAQQGKDMVVFISHSGNTQECVMHVPAQRFIAKGVIVLADKGVEPKQCMEAVEKQWAFHCKPVLTGPR